MLLAVAIGSYCFTACDKKPQKKKVVTQKKVEPKINVEAKFKEGRTLLLAGKYPEAAAVLAEVTADPGVSQPTLNWVSLHEAMAQLLANKTDAAKAIFSQIEERGRYSEKDTDAVQVNFFLDVAKNMKGPEMISADVAKDIDKWSYEGIALMIYGLKDWNMEKYDDAVLLLRQFANVDPEKMVAWADGYEELNQLKKLAENSANDYLAFLPATQVIQHVETLDQQQAAVDAARAARAQMKTVSKFSIQLDKIIDEYGPKVAAVMAAKEKASAEDEEFDAKALPAAKKKRSELLAKGLFTDARQAILDPPLRTNPARDEAQLLAKKASWLGNFKSQLIEDINKNGYNKPLNKRAGAATGGPAKRADEQSLYIETPKGPEAVPWGDLAPDALFTMAQSYIAADMPPEITSFRKWHLGVYGCYIGKTEESYPLMKEAAEVRTILKEELPYFEKPIPEGTF